MAGVKYMNQSARSPHFACILTLLLALDLFFILTVCFVKGIFEKKKKDKESYGTTYHLIVQKSTPAKYSRVQINVCFGFQLRNHGFLSGLATLPGEHSNERPDSAL
jgi:hypothetical protein